MSPKIAAVVSSVGIETDRQTDRQADRQKQRQRETETERDAGGRGESITCTNTVREWFILLI